MASISTSMKMKGYSKIQLMNSNNRSKSTDFTDQTIKTPKPISLTQDQSKTLDDDYDYNHYSGNNNNNNNNQEQQQDETFSKENMRINRSATSHGSTTDANSRFKIEKQHSTGRTLHTAVKRVLSVRRSSSVSERYARIHDQCSDYSFDVEADDEVLQMERSKNTVKKRSSGSVLKACKRIFGL